MSSSDKDHTKKQPVFIKVLRKQKKKIKKKPQWMRCAKKIEKKKQAAAKVRRKGLGT